MQCPRNGHSSLPPRQPLRWPTLLCSMGSKAPLCHAWCRFETSWTQNTLWLPTSAQMAAGLSAVMQTASRPLMGRCNTG